MIRVGDKYVRGAAVNAITPHVSDPENWSNVVLEDGTWLEVNAPAAVMADRVEADEVDVRLEGSLPGPKASNEVLCTLPAGFRPSRKSIMSLGTVVLVVEPDGNVYPGGEFHG